MVDVNWHLTYSKGEHRVPLEHWPLPLPLGSIALRTLLRTPNSVLPTSTSDDWLGFFFTLCSGNERRWQTCTAWE